MQITIDIPDEITEGLGETPEELRRRILESLAIAAYRRELITHFQVGQLLNIPSRWEVDALLKRNKVDLHYDEADLEGDRQTLRQLREKNAWR